MLFGEGRKVLKQHDIENVLLWAKLDPSKFYVIFITPEDYDWVTKEIWFKGYEREDKRGRFFTFYAHYGAVTIYDYPYDFCFFLQEDALEIINLREE